MRNAKYLWPLLFLALGCGYAKSGTWHDDPKNWERAFGEPNQSSAIVVHSYYLRSFHFTYEFIYYFEIDPNPEFEIQIFENNKMELVKGKALAALVSNIQGSAPGWFAPGPIGDYKAWQYAEEPKQRFFLLVHTSTRRLYMMDSQY